MPSPVETRSQYTMDRADAARFLGVSTRTLDRYVRSGKISSKKIGYHVMLSEKDITALKQELGERVEDQDVTVVVEEQVAKNPPRPQREEGIVTQDDLENEVYRVLYERTQMMIDKKQKEVELLNFRLGQMEVEMKNRVPLLEYQGSVEQMNKKTILLEEQVQMQEQQIQVSQRDIMIQKMLKLVYLGLFLVSLVALMVMFAIQ